MADNFENVGSAIRADTINGNIHNVNVTHINLTHRRKESDGIRFRVEPPENNFFGRLVKIRSLIRALEQSLTTNGTSTPYFVIVSGPPNIGKTQLVRQFIEENQVTYRNIIWINAETRDTLEESFKILAKDVLKISTTNANGSNTNFKLIVQHVVSKFSSSKTLFVYDNVDEPEIMKDLLEMKISGEKLHVIITSRIQDSGTEICVVRFDNFRDNYNSDDAEAYISRKLNNATAKAADKIMKMKNILVVVFIFVVAWYAFKYEIAKEMTTTGTSTTSTTTAPTTTTPTTTTPTTTTPTTTTPTTTTSTTTTQGPAVRCGPWLSCYGSLYTPCISACWHNTWEARDRQCRAMGSENCRWSFDAPLHIGGGRCFCCDKNCNKVSK